jgi:hypothetical protein
MRRALAVVSVLLVDACASCSPPPLTEDGGVRCDGGITDTRVDSSNCGACGVVCATGTRCAASSCTAADCSGAPCESFQVCVDNRCDDRACVGVLCPQGTVCANGACLPQDCPTSTCAPGAVCDNGQCVDSPCAGVLCPTGLSCVRGACVLTTCSDTTLDGDESDVDCGGSCTPCPAGKMCSRFDDCLSKRCEQGVCAQSDACFDHLLDGDETDVDCGGGSCPACAPGASCVRFSDCGSLACDDGRCGGDAGVDAGSGQDAGGGDAGVNDAGLTDAGAEDAGPGDSGTADAGGDAGAGDAGTFDAGTGGFVFAGSYPVTMSPDCIGTADFDGDGKLDIVVGGSATDTLSIFLGQGNGAFAAATPFDGGGFCNDMFVADVDHDGFADIVYATLPVTSSAAVNVIRGRGALPLAAPTKYALGSPARMIGAADFDGDGRLDVFADEVAPRIDTFFTQTDGGLAAGPQLLASAIIPAAGAGDLDGDGRADLAYQTTTSLLVAYARPGNTFAVDAGGSTPEVWSFAQVATLGPGTTPQLITSTDTQFGSVDVRAFNGSTFGAPSAFDTSGPASPHPTRFVVAPLDGDDLNDVAVLNNTTGTLSVLHNMGGGVLSQPAREFLLQCASPTAITAGNFDNDGGLDLAVACSTGFVVLLNAY